MKDILVCSVYIPPCNSKYFDVELFDQLEQDVVHFSSTGSVILMGDFKDLVNVLKKHLIKNGLTMNVE